MPVRGYLCSGDNITARYLESMPRSKVTEIGSQVLQVLQRIPDLDAVVVNGSRELHNRPSAAEVDPPIDPGHTVHQASRSIATSNTQL